MRVAIVVGVVVLVASGAARAVEPLPEGDAGIAARYPGDAGIDADPAVVFADDFEAYTDAAQLWDVWDNVNNTTHTTITAEAEGVFAGAQAIQFALPASDAEVGAGLDKVVSPELDVLFLRYYSKFMGPFDVVGSSHNGSTISSHYNVDGMATPGIPADGTNKFLVAYENWRGEATKASPGLINVYVYHPLQRSEYGDHFFPTGLVMPNTSLPFDFGPDFVARPDVIPELDRWYCWELMVQANAPGELDGRIAFWLDGVLTADFPNLRLRDVKSLTIDRFGIGLHAGNNPSVEQRKWYDNVVAATAYIGPLYEPGASDDSGGPSDDTGGASSADDLDGEGEGGPAGGGDDDGAATSGADGGEGGPIADTDAAAEGDTDDAGCGCTSTPTPRWLGLATLALFGVGRARRRRG